MRADSEHYSGIVQTPESPPIREPSEAVKKAVFRRDGGRCLCCGATKRLEIDHIVALYLGGSSDFEQLQTLCRTCNAEKRINELNFRLTRTPLDGPPRFTILEIPMQDDLADEETWLQYVRRSINFFYRCAAVDVIESEAKPAVFEVRLHPGIDASWIEPHIGNFSTRIAEERATAGLCRLETMRVTGMT